MATLRIHNLQKNYGPVKAVDQLSLELLPGQVMGLLGPNGSGKTTTLGILLDIIKKDGGTFQWFDGKLDPYPRRNIGALLETPNFYPYLNAEQNLAIIAQIKRKPQVDFSEILELINLSKRRKAPFNTYSLGMKQRLAIGAALVGNPEVLILDEPANGLDPQGIVEIRNTILEIAQSGKTILMASHILDEVEKTCSHVAIIKNGRLLATGPVGAVINNEVTIEVSCSDNEVLLDLLKQQEAIKNISQQGHLLILQVAEEFDSGKINELVFRNGITLQHLRVRQKSLEAEFLEITK